MCLDFTEGNVLSTSQPFSSEPQVSLWQTSPAATHHPGPVYTEVVSCRLSEGQHKQLDKSQQTHLLAPPQDPLTGSWSPICEVGMLTLLISPNWSQIKDAEGLGITSWESAWVEQFPQANT
jgi:hypothetical protein